MSQALVSCTFDIQVKVQVKALFRHRHEVILTHKYGFIYMFLQHKILCYMASFFYVTVNLCNVTIGWQYGHYHLMIFHHTIDRTAVYVIIIIYNLMLFRLGAIAAFRALAVFNKTQHSQHSSNFAFPKPVFHAGSNLLTSTCFEQVRISDYRTFKQLVLCCALKVISAGL